MRRRSQSMSAVYKLAVAVLGTWGLAAQLAEQPAGFLYFFTHISNMAVVAYLYGAAAHVARGGDAREPWHPLVKHALAMAITVTCLVAHFLLDGGGVWSGGSFHPQMLVLHYAVPAGMVGDWLLFDRKGTMRRWEPPLWTVFPLVYVAYIYVAVLGFGAAAGAGASGRWPYPFLDVDALGPAAEAGVLAALLAFFIALGYGYVAVDRALARRGK